jgi:hypothetical protein
MALGYFSVPVLGLLIAASPSVAQRADLTSLDRSPNDRTTLASSSEWALQAAETDLRDAPASTKDEPGFTFTARYVPSQHDDPLTTARGEVNWTIDKRNVLFGRVENLADDDLFPDSDDPLHERAFRVTKFQAGYARHIPLTELFTLTVGGSAAGFAKPGLIDDAYGDNPLGYTVFAKLSLGD